MLWSKFYIKVIVIGFICDCRCLCRSNLFGFTLQNVINLLDMVVGISLNLLGEQKFNNYMINIVYLTFRVLTDFSSFLISSEETPTFKSFFRSFIPSCLTERMRVLACSAALFAILTILSRCSLVGLGIGTLRFLPSEMGFKFRPASRMAFSTGCRYYKSNN